VGVGDDRLHTDQAARDPLPEEPLRERLGLRGAHVQGDDLPTAGLVHAVGDDYPLVLDLAAVADLLDLGVEEQIDAAALHGRVRNASTCSSSPAQMRLTSLRLTRSSRLSTTWSTRRVLTPHRYACWTTDNNACPERFLGRRKLGK